MLRPKANLLQVGREKAMIFYLCFFEKSGDFLSLLLFWGKPPFFGEKNGDLVFFCHLKTERSSFFCCFPCFPHYPHFFGQSPLFAPKSGERRIRAGPFLGRLMQNSLKTQCFKRILLSRQLLATQLTSLTLTAWSLWPTCGSSLPVGASPERKLLLSA